jgi:solute carrier family 35 protein C2
MWIKVSIGAFLAFAMEISEYLLLTNTSSLTLSITGIFKEICQLVLAVEFLNDQMSLINALGLVMCIGGICCHVIHKFFIYRNAQAMISRSINYDDNLDETEGGNFYKNIKYNQNQMSKSASKNYRSQSAPLLSDDEEGDSTSSPARTHHRTSAYDENQDEDPARESNDVLYDIIKRRER